MKFSIIIPTWNNLALLKLCVESIHKNSSFAHEIIIHVNEGSDGTLDWVANSGLLYTHSLKNIGICYAMNQAAAIASNDYIVYLNDDMYCCPLWDTHLVNSLRTIKNQPFMLSATMIEPRYSGNPCVVVANYGKSPADFEEARLLKEVESLAREDWLGSTWPPILMRKKDWHLIGGFSTEFSPGMSSDNDLSMKMWQMGCRIFLGVGNSLVYHFMSKSTTKIKKNPGRAQFLHKWGMTHSVFDHHFLKRGHSATPNQSVLPEPKNEVRYQLDIWKCKIKRLFV